MRIERATPADIADVIHGMDETDAAEQFARRFSTDRESLIEDLISLQERAVMNFAFRPGDHAIALLGAYLIGPQIVQFHRVCAFGWARYAPVMLRFGKTGFLPAIITAGIRRGEAWVPAKHTLARGILRRIGLVEEGYAKAYSRKGEDFVFLAWHNPTLDVRGRPLNWTA